MYKQIEHVIS